MAKKSKNSKLLVHYARTMTSDNLSKAANYVGKYVLKGLGAFGKIMTAPFVQQGPTSATIYKSKELLAKERTIENKSEELLGKAMTWVSPLNYGAALATGNGLNARKGEEEVASWSPAWQAVGRLGELYAGPKAVKGVKSAPRVVVNTAAKAGVKPAKAAVVAREIKLATKNKPNIEISNPTEYNISDNITLYRANPTNIKNLSYKGERYGDTSGLYVGKWFTDESSKPNWYASNMAKRGEEPAYYLVTVPRYWAKKQKASHKISNPNIEYEPEDYILEDGITGLNGQIYQGRPGTIQYLLLSFQVPKLKEPSTSLKFFERNPSKTSSTIQISPEELYKVLKDQELNGYYFMGHGTGRTNVNPLVIFDNGLRIKNGDIGNTTSPISLSNLSLWPHANSKEIIILPGKATMTKYDSAHGHIPSDWYSSDVFHWTDNPKKVGSGPFAAFEPNASFTEQTIGGVPGVYTKPEAILGSYNIDTQTLKLNPRSLYEFLFNVPKLTEPLTSLKFFERKPAKNNIVGTSLDYSMKDSKGIDYIKLFFALLKINGKEYTLEGLKDAANVQQGLPEHIQSYLNLNTVERAVRAMKKEGYSEREILLYVDKVNEEMNKVKVGMYSDLEYNAAGALNFGGFYNNDLNFISVNKDAYLSKPNFTSNYILKHEGRHLIDYNTSMTDDVINILEKAYDKDFLEIPKHEDAGSLKDYLHMDRERVTTNRDAREVFLSNLEKHPGEFLNLTKFAQTSFGKNKDMVDFLNELILYAEPKDIISAVENSNGYGKRYINYLKKNNKLTSAKIEQLRLAMIHVPSYLLPVAGGYTLYNLFNQPLLQLQYLKQGGKMNMIEFLKNGSGIHIKKENRGKFTDYCGGKVTSSCIAKGKKSSNPAIRKRATFALNSRRWAKHKNGGQIIQLFKIRRLLNNLIK